MLHNLIFALWFFLPAGVANAVPVISGSLPILKNWNTPMDLSKSYRGKRLLGDNKTCRGLLAGVVAATITAGLQYFIYNQYASFHLTKVSLVMTLLVGAFMGLGALLGDAVESFFKRQRGVEPGSGWFPFDQIDYIVGGLILTYPLVHLSLSQMLWILFTWFGVHIVTVYVCYLLGIRDKPI